MNISNQIKTLTLVSNLEQFNYGLLQGDGNIMITFEPTIFQLKINYKS